MKTTLLEARYLAGSRRLYDAFSAALRAQIDPRAFFNAKRLEQEERYARYSDTPYSLEPNCKESPGGLRDLQNVLWITLAAGLGGNWASLARRGLITRAEVTQLNRAENFLRNLRIRLHLLTGRREDRLIFDHQEALARSFGLAPSAAKRAAEILMQRYYRNAKSVTQLNTTVPLLQVTSKLWISSTIAFLAADGAFSFAGTSATVSAAGAGASDAGIMSA